MPALADVGVVVLLGAAYFGAAKLGQTLRYTASVSAIWPPAGFGIAVLYLWGLRWWPGILLGELLVNGELLLDNAPLPLGSLAGQQVGNMAEILVGAWLLRRLIGPRAALDRASQVGGLIVAASTATALSATFGTVSMFAGSVIDLADVPTFWRTWFLGDTAGALVVLPFVLTWLRDPRVAWRRLRAPEGAALIGSVVVLSIVSVTSNAPVTYLLFPALIWAAFRFGPAGATLAIAINAGLTIGITADRLGVFFKQPISDRTMSTQLYILVTALTALYLSAVVSERERSVAELAESKLREAERGLEDRRRIARELHDSVSQALFSSVLHTRVAQKAAAEQGGTLSRTLASSLSAIADLTRSAQSEMRRFIFEWGPEGIDGGFIPALTHSVSTLRNLGELAIEVEGFHGSLPLATDTQAQLLGITREALANVVKHSGARTARVVVESRGGQVAIEITDDGCGFVPASAWPGSFGLESMRSRAEEIGGVLRISSSPGEGTVVRVEVPVADAN